jgi:hypothetical protein
MPYDRVPEKVLEDADALGEWAQISITISKKAK